MRRLIIARRFTAPAVPDRDERVPHTFAGPGVHLADNASALEQCQKIPAVPLGRDLPLGQKNTTPPA